MANNIMEEADKGKEEANLAVSNRKRAIFLTEIAPEAYSTLSNLLVQVKPKDTPIADRDENVPPVIFHAPANLARNYTTNFW